MRPTCGVIVLLAIGLALATDDKKDGKKPAKLEGTYIIVALEKGGERIPAEFFDKASEEDRTIKITADKLIATKNGKEDAITYKIDTSKTPAHITTVEVKDGKTETSYGIYKLEGDSLTICLVDSEKAEDRPKEFKSVKGSKAVIMTLKRK
jgi:uncharacterized protein (TIGR03067 family)